jgi:hypothetical protein
MRDGTSFLAFAGAIFVALVGLLGMRILTGVAVTGTWPRGRSEWIRYIFISGPVRVPRFQLFAILWFLGCGALAISSALGVMLLGRMVLD